VDVDSYIAKYGPEWKRLERSCARGSRGLAKLPGEEIDEVVRLYLRASSHLATVRTRYYDLRLQAYLNGVVAGAHAAIYGSRPHSLRQFLRVFGPRYRAAIKRTAPFILVAAGLVIVLVVLTDVWVATSRQAEAGLIPSEARDAIRRAGGRAPDLGIAPPALSTVILENNLLVSFLAFAFGITLGVGTLYVLTQNAVLLGALGGAFGAGGKAGAFWSLILPHGLLEITAICIAAGAGLRMGWSLIDPGDRPRSVALADEARDAVLVVVGVIPAFIAAALIEGFITGRTGLPPVEIAVGAGVAALYLLFLFGPFPSGRRADGDLDPSETAVFAGPNDSGVPR
jgi:uncharacterized membrane protein SpoIIM required for sporulation